MKCALLWGYFGPYHHARLKGLQEAAGRKNAIGIEYASASATYPWDRTPEGGIATLCPGREEEVSPISLFRALRRELKARRADVVFIPSCWPATSVAAITAAASLGLRRVMMNESFGATAKARGWRHWAKKRLVGSFHAALVGGAPHKRWFASLGMPEENIFTGYDAVDNAYFSRAAAEAVRNRERAKERFNLPQKYFLSLGRMAPKKNLKTLISAFAHFRHSRPRALHHLVMVGSGEEEPFLRLQAARLNLPVYDRAHEAGAKVCQPSLPPGVHFYGFRQIDQNPVFYALSEAFILPSLAEEWGLVVNEAMACGKPVIVSARAGCAEDLARHGLNGFQFNPANAAELAERMAWLADEDSASAGMGQASLQIIARWDCGNFARNALRAAEAALRAPSALS